MILGSIEVTEKAVTTHRDSYLLNKISVVSVRRPLLGGALLISAGTLGFTVSFADILYASEITTLLSVAAFALLFGTHAGQLKLVSRELSGNPLADVIWGRYASLNQHRLKIAGKMQELEAEGDVS